MKRFLHFLDTGADRVLKAVAIISSMAIIFLILFLVVARYLLGWSVVGVMDLVLVSSMWLYMSGAMIASRQNEHLVVDFLYQQLGSERAKAWHQLAIGLASFVVCGFFVLWAWKMMAWGMRLPQSTPALSIPLLVPQTAIMVAAVICMLYALRDAARGLRDVCRGAIV